MPELVGQGSEEEESSKGDTANGEELIAPRNTNPTDKHKTSSLCVRIPTNHSTNQKGHTVLPMNSSFVQMFRF